MPKFFIPQHPRMDANTSIFFSRQLEQISQENFDPKYTENMAMKIVPMDQSVDPLAERWTYRSYDSLGEAALIKDYSKAGFPRVGENGTEVSVPLRDYGDSFGYSIDELKRSQRIGQSLDTNRARIARQVVAQKLESVICTGDSAAGLSGFLNLSGINTMGAVSGWSAAGYGLTSNLIETATAAEQLAFLHALVLKAPTATRHVEKCRRIVLYPLAYQTISTTPRSSTSDTTVKQFFLANHPGIEIVEWERLADAGTGGSPMIMAYDPDPIKVRCLLPIAFEQMSPELDGMEYSTLCRARTGGVIAPFPKSITKADFGA